MNLLQFLQVVTGDPTHVIILVWMIVSYQRQKTRYKALQAHVARLEGIIKAIERDMPKKPHYVALSKDSEP